MFDDFDPSVNSKPTPDAPHSSRSPSPHPYIRNSPSCASAPDLATVEEPPEHWRESSGSDFESSGGESDAPPPTPDMTATEPTLVPRRASRRTSSIPDDVRSQDSDVYLTVPANDPSMTPAIPKRQSVLTRSFNTLDTTPTPSPRFNTQPPLATITDKEYSSHPALPDTPTPAEGGLPVIAADSDSHGVSPKPADPVPDSSSGLKSPKPTVIQPEGDKDDKEWA